MLDLTGYLGDELPRRIFQHDRLQREAPRALASLDQRAAAQRLDGFEHLRSRERCAPAPVSNSSMLTGSRRMASHSSTVCSISERRANCSPSSSRTLPKTTSPCSRNGAISPPKSSTMVCATILRASGLPPYRSISRCPVGRAASYVLLHQQLLTGHGIQS